MEKLLFKEDRKSLGVSFLRGFKPLFAPFRYAPLHKEGFENCKQYLGLKIKCKFETGLASLKCKHFLGRVKVSLSIILIEVRNIVVLIMSES